MAGPLSEIDASLGESRYHVLGLQSKIQYRPSAAEFPRDVAQICSKNQSLLDMVSIRDDVLFLAVFRAVIYQEAAVEAGRTRPARRARGTSVVVAVAVAVVVPRVLLMGTKPPPAACFPFSTAQERE